jgi:uncharacterized protein YerC
MTKISKKPVDPEKLGFYINNLWAAFTLMDSKADIRLLFKDLFTHTEYKMFAKRLEIARRLLKGENYLNIQRDLKVTAGTVGRISNILAEQRHGLKMAHEKLSRLEEKYFAQQEEIIKNKENPFRKKLQRNKVLGEALKMGAVTLGETIDRKLKNRTAKKMFSV